MALSYDEKVCVAVITPASKNQFNSTIFMGMFCINASVRNSNIQFGFENQLQDKVVSFFLFLELTTTVLDMQTMPLVVFRLLHYIRNPPHISVVSEDLFTL